jgi:ribosomal protein L40E
MLAILNTAGLKTAKISPLSQIKGQPVPLDARKLQSAGLTDNAGRPTPAFQEALAILANPATEIDLIWGNPDGISLSKVYAAAGQDKMVSFTNSDSSNNISYFLSPQDITDLLTQRLVFSEIKNIAPLNTEIPPTALPALFGALDIYRESQLRAALDRRQETSVTIEEEELNRIVQEAKTETNFSWYAPVAYNIIPVGTAITESAVNEGLKTLKNEGLIGSGGELSSALNTFASRAFPMAGFFGIKVLTVSAESAEKTQLALFRGISTLLLVQLTAENGKDRALVSSISTSQLPELLFNLSTRPFEAPAPPAQPAAPPSAANTVFCNKCGTKNDTKAKFCSKCGAPLAVAAPAQPSTKFCGKCGSPVKPGVKFCDKCGAPVK